MMLKPSHSSSIQVIYRNGLPTCLREHFARQGSIQVARVIDILYRHSAEMELGFTRTQLKTLAAEYYVGHNTIDTVLKAQVITTWGVYPVFETQSRKSSPASPPISPPEMHPDSSITNRVQPEGQNSSPGRPSKRYLLPDAFRLCNLIGKSQCLLTDPLQATDLISTKNYALAMHREFLRRAPGAYSRSFLARRIGVCLNTLREYEHKLQVQVKKRTQRQDIMWNNLESLLERTQIAYGLWLEDEEGFKYPATYQCADQLLQDGHQLTLVKQLSNHYSLPSILN